MSKLFFINIFGILGLMIYAMTMIKPSGNAEIQTNLFIQRLSNKNSNLKEINKTQILIIGNGIKKEISLDDLKHPSKSAGAWAILNENVTERTKVWATKFPEPTSENQRKFISTLMVLHDLNKFDFTTIYEFSQAFRNEGNSFDEYLLAVLNQLELGVEQKDRNIIYAISSSSNRKIPYSQLMLNDYQKADSLGLFKTSKEKEVLMALIFNLKDISLEKKIHTFNI